MEIFDKDAFNDIILKRIDFSGEVLKLLFDENRDFNKTQVCAVCEILGVPYRIVREDETWNQIDGNLLHGRLDLEFENGKLVDATME